MSDGIVNTKKGNDGMRIETVHISKIKANKFQPRKTTDAEKMEELKESVGSVGMIDPIMVRPIEGGEYEIIKGHRRFDVLTEQGKKMITVLVKEGVDDNRSALEAFISNECRSDLDPFERAAAIRKVQELYNIKKERDLATFLGMSYWALKEALVYENLSDDVKELVRGGELNQYQAGKIRDIPNFDEQMKMARVINKNALNPLETQKAVKAVNKAPEPIKEAILDQRIDPRDAITIMENNIPEDMAEAVVEELEERKARRDAHNAIEKEADAATLSGRMTTTQFKRLKSEDEKAYDRVMSWRDQFFIQPVSLVYDIQDGNLRQSAMKALESVIDKATIMVRKAQVKDGYDIPAEDLEVYR